MFANVETMFYVREKPWHGLGTLVMEAPASADALVWAGLNWKVIQKEVRTEDGAWIAGYKANIRSTDGSVLGIVSDRYKVVQNEDAFRFTDELLGEGVTYETAGSLQYGRKVGMLPGMPQRYITAGGELDPSLVIMNSHDGGRGVRVAMTPIRFWAARHTEYFLSRVREASETLRLAELYMSELGRGVNELAKIKLSDRKAMDLMQNFFPISEDLSDIQRKNNLRILDDLKRRYFDAPDLLDMGKNGYRFVNAVSDFATHAEPIRKTKNYNENLFLRTVEGNPMIDRAYKMVLAA